MSTDVVIAAAAVDVVVVVREEEEKEEVACGQDRMPRKRASSRNSGSIVSAVAAINGLFSDQGGESSAAGFVVVSERDVVDQIAILMNDIGKKQQRQEQQDLEEGQVHITTVKDIVRLKKWIQLASINKKVDVSHARDLVNYITTTTAATTPDDDEEEEGMIVESRPPCSKFFVQAWRSKTTEGGRYAGILDGKIVYHNDASHPTATIELTEINLKSIFFGDDTLFKLYELTPFSHERRNKKRSRRE